MDELLHELLQQEEEASARCFAELSCSSSLLEGELGSAVRPGAAAIADQPAVDLSASAPSFAVNGGPTAPLHVDEKPFRQ